MYKIHTFIAQNSFDYVFSEAAILFDRWLNISCACARARKMRLKKARGRHFAMACGYIYFHEMYNQAN